MRSLSCSLLLIALTGTVTTQGQENLNVSEVVRRIDDLYRSDSSHGRIEMQIVTPNWDRTLAMELWTEGLRKTFVRIERPAKEKGVATLRIGTEMWNYLPKTNKVIKIPPSMMMSSWMGSDFTNDDIVKEFTFWEDYTFEFFRPQDAREDLLYIRCTPREGLPVVWAQVVIAARREGYIPVWLRYYDEKDALMRTLDYRDIRELGGRRIPATMEMVPATKEGHLTVVRYLELEFNVPLDGEVFSLRNLRSTP